jgi:hypothetical protein
MKVYIRYLMILSVICSSMIFLNAEEYEDYLIRQAALQDAVKVLGANPIYKEKVAGAEAKIAELQDLIELEELDMEEKEMAARKEAAMAFYQQQKAEKAAARKAQREVEAGMAEQRRISSALGRPLGETFEPSRDDLAAVGMLPPEMQAKVEREQELRKIMLGLRALNKKRAQLEQEINKSNRKIRFFTVKKNETKDRKLKARIEENLQAEIASKTVLAAEYNKVINLIGRETRRVKELSE